MALRPNLPFPVETAKGDIMEIEHGERQHSSIHTATVDKTDPRAPRRNIAKDIVSSSQRLRQRIAVSVGLCIGLAALVIVLE